MIRPIRVAMIHDIEVRTPGGLLQWAYARRTEALAKYAPPDFEVLRYSDKEADANWPKICRWADIVFALDYTLASAYRRRLSIGEYRGLFVASFNKDSRSHQRTWEQIHQYVDWLIVNNAERYYAGGCRERTSYVQNGYDPDLWHVTRPIESRPDRVLWTGGDGPRKRKNYHEILAPLRGELARRGFDCDFRVVRNITSEEVLPAAELLDWYNGGGYVLCASETEGGGPNFVVEAAACGCVPVSTLVGGVPEYLVDGQNGVAVEPNPESILSGLEAARSRRVELATRMVSDIGKLAYGAPGGPEGMFYGLFRRLVHSGPNGIPTYDCRNLPEGWGAVRF